jgi:hypothetical protein
MKFFNIHCFNNDKPFSKSQWNQWHRQMVGGTEGCVKNVLDLSNQLFYSKLNAEMVSTKGDLDLFDYDLKNISSILLLPTDREALHFTPWHSQAACSKYRFY